MDFKNTLFILLCKVQIFFSKDGLCEPQWSFPQLSPTGLIEAPASLQSQVGRVVGCRLHGPVDCKVGFGETCSLWTNLIDGIEITAPTSSGFCEN